MPARPKRVVQIADEADERSMIEHKRYEKTLILGPAIIAPIDTVSFIGNEFFGGLDALLIEIPEDREVAGIIGLRDVVFQDCRFENVGIAGTPESVAEMRRQFEAH